MNLTQAQSALEYQQNAFHEVVQQPNTLARNIVLAEHRAEMARLHKLIVKFAEPGRSTRIA